MHEKFGFLGPRARVLGSALPEQSGEKGTAQSAGQGHGSDEKIILPPLLSLDLMRRQTICEQWHSQIGPKGYEWETSKPAHVSATVKGFVSHIQIWWTFPCSLWTALFCWHVQIMNLLCVGSLYAPLLLSPVPSCRVGMLCRPFHRLSQAYGEPLTCWLPGTRVSGSTSRRAVVCLFLLSVLEALTPNLIQLLLQFSCFLRTETLYLWLTMIMW